MLSDVVLLLSGGQLGPGPLIAQGQLSLLLQCLSLEHIGLLLLSAV